MIAVVSLCFFDVEMLLGLLCDKMVVLLLANPCSLNSKNTLLILKLIIFIECRMDICEEGAVEFEISIEP